MKRIFLGLDANRKPVYLSPKMRQETHTHVIGGSGTGKSKFLEWLIRQDIQNGQGLCVIDWHGTLYKDVLRWCHQEDIGIFDDHRSVILVNPSQPDFITGFNPFSNDGSDVSTQVSSRIDAIIRPWGITDTNEMPTFERVCRALFTFMVETHEPLPNAAKLLNFEEVLLREYAVGQIKEAYAAQIWADLQRISLQKHSAERDWRDSVLSTVNRLNRFISSTAIRRFMGLWTGNLNFEAIMDQGKIVIVNLGFSDFLPTDAARVFASLFLNEFFVTAKRRANRLGNDEPLPFILYLDEFQEYITDDIAAMLDQVRKGGLHLVLAHQHLGHFVENPRLQKAVLTNARIRAVFGGLDYQDACILGNEMFLPDLNTRQIKKAYYHTIHVFKEELREQKTHGQVTGTSWGKVSSSGIGRSTTSSESSGSGDSSGGAMMSPLTGEPTEGWFTETSGSSAFHAEGSSESESEFTSESQSEGGSQSEINSTTTGTVFVPIPVKELGSESEWSREEKLSKVAQTLKEQMQRHCFIKLDRQKTQPLLVPNVETDHVEPETLDEYQGMLYERQGSLPAAEVDKLLVQSEEDFMARAVSKLRPKPDSKKHKIDDEEFLE